MNFGQLCDQVAVITNRPDLVAETQLAVRRSTLYLHGIDTFFRDLAEKRLTFDATSSQFSVDILKNFTGLRKLRYIKAFDVTTGVIKRDIKVIQPDNLWDEFGRYKSDVYYVAGNNLNMKTSEAESSFLIGYYTMPNVTDAFYSWIADIYPYAIIEDAAGRILHMIGQIDEGNKFVDPQKGSVKTTHIPWLIANGLSPEA
jgi:hypothetical protein